MKEMARLSGISRATISAVLNDKPGVSQKMRERVMQCVNRHNYRPNRIAITLVRKTSNLICYDDLAAVSVY